MVTNLKAGKGQVKKKKKKSNVAVFKEEGVDREWACQIIEKSNLASAVALPAARLIWVQEC